MNIPEGLTGKTLYKYLVDNKSLLIASKKAVLKEADSFTLQSSLYVDEAGRIVKAFEPIPEDARKLEATLIINTTNILDSHSDVHIPGLWKKSLKELRDVYHIQEHKMQFDKVISEDVNAFTRTYSWRELGYDANGMTEALVFVSNVDKSRNEFMFDQYRKGFVKNHSVGMRYVKIELCVNEPEDRYYRDEFEAWTKYIEMVVNREDADAQGYFWAVTEAKIIEGSAVVKGSCPITPTQSVRAKSTETQPPSGTEDQPREKFDLDKAIKEINFFN